MIINNNLNLMIKIKKEDKIQKKGNNHNMMLTKNKNHLINYFHLLNNFLLGAKVNKIDQMQILVQIKVNKIKQVKIRILMKK